jgi:hypothetical protein
VLLWGFRLILSVVLVKIMFFIAIFAEKLRFLVALEPFLHDMYYKGVS